ncbi:hypothetical protein Bca52824_080046 [Brassica carinata]|uniref:Uncharacterized protein n=1 Tax=Brassica carinata TaxID=52824 RepID=A0A8X7Q0E1_BRACI|nr:hypothetical protein Bca52824_080046 [Brassica carinata]
MSSFGYVPNARAMNMMMDVRNFFSFDIALSQLCNRTDLVLGVFCRIVEGFQVVGLMICSGVVNVWRSMLVSGFFRSGFNRTAFQVTQPMSYYDVFE